MKKRPYTKRKRAITDMAKRVLAAAIDNPDGTLAEIGKAARIPGKNAGQQAGRILRKPNIQERYRELMANTPGLGDQEILDRLAEGMNAKKIERFAYKGKVKSMNRDIDYPTRKSYLDLATRLNGAQVQKHEITGKDGAPILPDPVLNALDKMSEPDLKKLIKSLTANG